MNNTLLFVFMVLIGLFDGFCEEISTERRQKWDIGCYRRASNGTRVETGESGNGPSYCTYVCTKKGTKFTAVQGEEACYCLQELKGHQKVSEHLCNISCTKLSHLRCGGDGSFVSIYHTSVPIIFNHSLESPAVTAVNVTSRFVSKAWLTNTSGAVRNSSLSAEHLPTSLINTTWTVGGSVVKSVSKRVSGLQFQDGFNKTFSSFGRFKVCANVTNGHVWISECSTVFAVESIRALKIVNVHGVKHIADGKYAIVRASHFHIDVVVNAGSFADLHFDFGDASKVVKVKRGYESVLQTCSCLALTRKGHFYRDPGFFSLNITAANQVGRKELVFTDKVTVERKIQGCKLTTKFVAAGKTREVRVQVFEALTPAHYRWTHPDNRQETTTVPFIHVLFPRSSPQYHLKVVAFNNVSETDCSGRIVYVEPELRGVALQTATNQVKVNENVIFTSTVAKDRVSFDSFVRYTWNLGDGQILQGTLANLVYGFRESGRFKVRVMVENYHNKVHSNIVTVDVFKVITQVKIQYKPFRFGQMTKFTASVADGTNMTYSWDFGDNVTLSTDNGTIHHKYKSLGNFTVRLTVANPVSSMEDSIAVFVLPYDCQKPEVTFARLPLEETTRKAQELKIDVDVGVCCSVSSSTAYKWTVYLVRNGVKEERNALQLGVSPSILNQRSLVLPPNTLNPGSYLVELMVTMERTIVYTKISKRINVQPTEMRAFIYGGDVVSVGRRRHENVTLDASHSFDPDGDEAKPLRFSWHCRSIIDSGHEPCFKANLSTQLNWTQPVFSFLPKMLSRSSSLFVFMATVSNDQGKSATAYQFVRVESKETHRIVIGCSECRNPDVNAHKKVAFEGACKDCEKSTVAFKWKIYSIPKVKVFLRLFGKCIPANGSAWQDKGGWNETNATTTAMIPITTSAAMTTIITTTTTGGPTGPTHGADFQKLICEGDLKSNAATLLRRRRDSDQLNVMPQQVATRRKAHEGPEDWNEFDLDDGDDIASEDLSSKADREELDAARSNGRVTRDVAAYNTSFAGGATGQGRSSGSSPFNPTTGNEHRPYSSGTGAIQSDDDNSVTGGSGFPQASGSGRGNPGGGTGSGRPNSMGSGRGCEGAAGVAAGRGAGSGSGTVGGCSDGFGEGAKAHQNKTSGTNSTEEGDKGTGTSADLITKSVEEQLEEKLKMIREFMHPVEVNSLVESGSQSARLTLQQGSLVPGQLYMVELTALWGSGTQERVAGQAQTYFLTNTGPFLGSCRISPTTGLEASTVFSLQCKHWKDMHYPIKFSLRYKTRSIERPILLYHGLNEKLNFTLPAGDETNGHKIALEIVTEDAAGAKTKLCPIHVVVMPLESAAILAEEYLHNQTLGKNSLLDIYDDLSDEDSATVFITTVIGSLNRLAAVSQSSYRHRLRLEVRTRLIRSLSRFPVQSEVSAAQQSRLARELVYRPPEVSMDSMKLANKVNRKIISFFTDSAKRLPSGIAQEIFAIVSSILHSTSDRKRRTSNRSFSRLLSKEAMEVHEIVAKALQKTASKTVLKSEFISTTLIGHEESIKGVLSSNGCSFVLPVELGGRITNRIGLASPIYSQMSVYESNPFSWAAKKFTIDTKVASLDFKTSEGTAIRVANLTEAITVTLPVQHPIMVGTWENQTEITKMNVHEFNFSNSEKSMTFIKIEKKSEELVNDNFALKAFVRFDGRPTEKLHNRSLSFRRNTASLHLPSDLGVSKVFVGIIMKTVGRITKKTKQVQPIKYKLDVFSVSCRFWNDAKEIWSNKGCNVSLESTTKEAVCRCNHLTAFGAQVRAVNVVVEAKSLVSFKRDGDQHLVLAVLLSVLCLYLMLTVAYKMSDKSGYWDSYIACLPDNHPADLFRYLVVVETGSSHDAGTTARVSIVVYGEEGHSQIRELTCHNVNQFKRGSVDAIIMSFPDSLGDIKKISLWHDNGGNSPNWYLKQISIVDCQTENVWYFPWNGWVAISECTRADCEIPAEKDANIYNAQTIFEGILDYHLWLSIFTAPSRSIFSKCQRLALSLASLVGFMMFSAMMLSSDQSVEILGLWDIKWSSFVTSVIVAVAVFPVQLVMEALFRNSSGSKSEEEDQEDANVPASQGHSFKEDEMKSQGALFFMEVNSAIYSSQNMLCKDETESVSEPKEGCRAAKESQCFTFPVWCQSAWLWLCVLFSFSGMTVTLWYGNRFDDEKAMLWAQTLLICFICGIGVLEVLKAIVLAMRRLSLVKRDAVLKEYLALAHLYQNELGSPFVGASEPNEKQILAARARARFVRFSKPILKEELRKARRRAARWNDLSSFTWNLFTIAVYTITLAFILVHSNTREEYRYQKAIKEMITSPVRGSSFTNISTPAQFFYWTELKLVDLLRWDRWFHSRTLHPNSTLSDQRHGFNNIYTFGPACFEKSEKLQKTEIGYSNRSAYNSTHYGAKVLLSGTRNQMLTMLRSLRHSGWFTRTTSLVTISFSFFHPESNSFSFTQLSVKVSPLGKLDSKVQVESITLFSQCGAVEGVTIALKILSLLLVLISLREQSSWLIDRGLKHFQNKWHFIEGLLIIFSLLAVSAEMWEAVEAKKTIYQVESMHIFDPDVFLDLSTALTSIKMARVIYATLFFLVLLKSVSLLHVLARVSAILTMLATVFFRMLALVVTFILLIIALFHVGTLVHGRSSWLFMNSETTLLVLWSSLARGHPTVLGDAAPSSAMMYAYNVLAAVTVFTFWLVSAVYVIGRFRAEKHLRKRRIQLQKSLKLIFKKLHSKKTWWQIFNAVWKRFSGRQEDKYKSCDLPLENIYEEIEYQVEEVIFRLSNLYDMSDFLENNEGQVDGDDEYTLDSSEEAAYPSSHSKNDSISFTSESIHSEDSGYYRYGDYRGAFPSGLSDDDDYEGPIIHYLDSPRQRLSSLGQVMSPIFGGRYFVKTSWSTFRAPKVKPAEIKPPPKIELPQSSSRKTFEKVRNWSSKVPTEKSCESPEAAESGTKLGLEMLDAFPKALPKTAKLTPLPPIRIPAPHRNKTLEKIRNWSTQLNVAPQPGLEDASIDGCFVPCHFEYQGHNRRLDRDELDEQRILSQAPNSCYEQSLPLTAVNAPSIKFVPRLDENATSRPKIPPIQKVMAPRRRSYKRTKVSPLNEDAPGSQSSSSGAYSLPREVQGKSRGDVGKARSSSLDSGIIRTSDNEDSEVCYDFLQL